MKKKIVAKAQKRKRRNKQKYIQHREMFRFEEGSISDKQNKIINKMRKENYLSSRSISKIMNLTRNFVKKIIRQEDKNDKRP